MNVACPKCSTVYRIDPVRIPETGAATRCRECSRVFRVTTGIEQPGRVMAGEAVAEETAGAEASTAVEEPGAGAESTAVEEPRAAEPARGSALEAPARPGTPVFGPQDPDTRARRLARALVSDIKVYNAERWEESRSVGTLRKDFRDDILKSWEEYVEQVGEPMAKRTPYFRDALNDILAGGERVF